MTWIITVCIIIRRSNCDKQYYETAGGDPLNVYGIPVEDDGGGSTAGGHPEEGDNEGRTH